MGESDAALRAQRQFGVRELLQPISEEPPELAVMGRSWQRFPLHRGIPLRLGSSPS
jgi:hypothetical protein